MFSVVNVYSYLDFCMLEEHIFSKLNVSEQLKQWATNISSKYSTWIVISALKDYFNTTDLTKIKNSLQFEDTRLLLSYIEDNAELYKKIITDLFKVDNKPALNLKTLTLVQANRYVRHMNHITEWTINSSNSVFDIKNLDWEETISKSIEWHSNILDDTTLIEKGEVFIKFSDGFYWINLQKNYCEDEEINMKHCGRTAGTTLFSLRDKNKKSHLTAGYNEKTHTLVGLKGRANTIPKEKYHSYIVALLLNTKYPIDGFSYEYDNEKDFKLFNLTKSQLNHVLNVKPQFNT